MNKYTHTMAEPETEKPVRHLDPGYYLAPSYPLAIELGTLDKQKNYYRPGRMILVLTNAGEEDWSIAFDSIMAEHLCKPTTKRITQEKFEMLWSLCTKGL